MVFYCSDCESEYWRKELESVYCPDCNTKTRRVVGSLEEKILQQLSKDSAGLTTTEIASQLDEPVDLIKESVTHLIDFGYLRRGDTISEYRLSKKGRIEYC